MKKEPSTKEMKEFLRVKGYTLLDDFDSWSAKRIRQMYKYQVENDNRWKSMSKDEKKIYIDALKAMTMSFAVISQFIDTVTSPPASHPSPVHNPHPSRPSVSNKFQ